LLSAFHESPVRTRASQKRRACNSSPPKLNQKKKPVSGSITSLLPDKDKEPLPKHTVEHFQKLCMVKQTGNNEPPKTDFERITSKKSMLDFSKLKHQQKLDEEKARRAQNCKDMAITEEDLDRLENEDGHLVSAPTKLAWTFEHGKDLVCPEELGGLPMKMRNLHDWYKRQSGIYFGVRYPKEFFGQIIEGSPRHDRYLEYKFLFHLYQQDALDVNILFLWCL